MVGLQNNIHTYNIYKIFGKDNCIHLLGVCVPVYLLCPVRVAASKCVAARWLVIFIHGHRYRTQIAEQ